MSGKLSFKIIGSLFLVLILVAAATIILTYYREKNLKFSEIVSSGSKLADVLSLSAQELLLLDDYPALETIIKQVKEREKNLIVVKVKKDQMVVVNIANEDVQKNENALSFTKDILVKRSEFESDQESDFKIGSIELTMSTKAHLNDLNASFKKIIFIVSIIFVAIMITLYFILHYLVINPVHRFKKQVENMQDVDGKDLVSINSEDEIGDLANSFNHLFTALKQSTISRKYFENILDSLTDSVFVISKRSNKITYANSASLEMLGVPKEEVLQIPLDKIFSSKQKNISAILNGEALSGVQTEISTQKNTLHVLVSSAGVPDVEKSSDSLLISVQDISELYASQERERFEKLFLETVNSIEELEGGASKSIKLISTYFKFDSANIWIRQLEGWKVSELNNISLIQADSLKSEDNRFSIDDQFFYQDDFPNNQIFSVESKNQDCTYHISKLIIETNPLAILAFCSEKEHDLKENDLKFFNLLTNHLSQYILRRLNEKLFNNQQKRILNAAKLTTMGQLAGEIAHEVNNPLTIIIGEVGLISQLTEDAEINKAELVERCEKIEDIVMRISKVTRGLLAMSRGGYEEKFTEVSVDDIMEDVHVLMSERFRRHFIDFSFNSSSKNCFFVCSKIQITQVLINILNNSVDALDSVPQKKIQLQFVDHADRVEIKIRDNGIGISNDDIDKITDPLYSTKTVSGKGTGFGLSIVKRILEMHGGKLHVSLEDDLTNFIVELPKNSRKKEAS